MKILRLMRLTKSIWDANLRLTKSISSSNSVFYGFNVVKVNTLNMDGKKKSKVIRVSFVEEEDDKKYHHWLDRKEKWEIAVMVKVKIVVVVKELILRRGLVLRRRRRE
ncbi:unnamed protein product [Arabidopsis lyrata]|uniref:Predicted protein n=1 Tax=Arabidopsis lyrata subsp. lyrata TaxID=81972 RepID=D7L7I8_ARALL|nr:hypothetical protein ARALYDRAFT_356872 [Arabidopsis lyrata subsp. lyrata]EFH47284.1 hypothetical protein ARALYDRAFT_349613 [Arabidopsis lyrata subsp. lyrata]EFH60251.1 predicted protein [Arabidopsis lyrata subsp. lyrata]CAH8262741.1 unnamed protein product [Arabidopsis lyrata]CAH8269886.1 unnamed protein product [Arabidopsis lyrata]